MKYLGNFRFIKDEWINEILSKEGKARPRDWPAVNAVESSEYAKAKEAGYDLNSVHWWVYEKDDVNLKGKRFIARGCGAVMSDRRKKTLYT